MRLAKLNNAITSAGGAGTTWCWQCHAEWWSIFRCPSVHPSHDHTVQTGCSEPCATVTLSDPQIPRWDSEQQPPAQTASRTEALQPASDVWIKVGLLPSCLHNNTLDTSSAAVGACGSDYLAGRRSLSLWLANGPGTVPVPVTLNKSAELILGHTYTWWTPP